jgi:protein-S-isoprenylcysteine O-methyltransferase Ste14
LIASAPPAAPPRSAMLGHAAFAAPATQALQPTFRRGLALSSARAPLRPATAVARRPSDGHARMAAAAGPATNDDDDDDDEKNDPAAARRAASSTAGATSSSPVNDNDDDAPMFTAPSFDTTVFSDFVDGAQEKLDELQAQITDIDSEALAEDVKTASIGLVDNLIAGDWLNRGELYGAGQFFFAVLLLRSPGFLDGIIGFIVGPATLFTGAGIALKALFDLGRKQLSIWPAPVPGGQLKTAGLYNVVRHPLYAGVLLSTLGYASATGSPERVALAVAFAFFLAKKIDIEEDYLCDTYPDYSSYQEDVPFKLIPRIF